MTSMLKHAIEFTHFRQSQQNLIIINFMKVEFIAELLHWIALDCTGVPNKVADERIYCIYTQGCSDKMCKMQQGLQFTEATVPFTWRAHSAFSDQIRTIEFWTLKVTVIKLKSPSCLPLSPVLSLALSLLISSLFRVLFPLFLLTVCPLLLYIFTRSFSSSFLLFPCPLSSSFSSCFSIFVSLSVFRCPQCFFFSHCFSSLHCCVFVILLQ